jgi:hypothetical protein
VQVRRGCRAAADRLLNYVSERQDMINYPEFISKGWQIGSGPTTAIQAPSIRVEFLVDDAGNPTYSDNPDRLGTIRRHYDIRVTLASPPPDTWNVTFYLHESYYDPVRETRKPEFSFTTTTYGDYIIQAKIYGSKGVDVLAANLSESLRKSYSGTTHPAILHAIDEIQSQ